MAVITIEYETPVSPPPPPPGVAGDVRVVYRIRNRIALLEAQRVAIASEAKRIFDERVSLEGLLE